MPCSAAGRSGGTDVATSLIHRQLLTRASGDIARMVIRTERGLVRQELCDGHGHSSVLQAGALLVSQPPTPGSEPLPVMLAHCAFRARITQAGEFKVSIAVSLLGASLACSARPARVRAAPNGLISPVLPGAPIFANRWSSAVTVGPTPRPKKRPKFVYDDQLRIWALRVALRRCRAD